MSLQELPKAQVATPTGEEAPKPTSPAYDMADQPPRGPDKEAFQPKAHPAPRRHLNKNVKAWGNTPDLRDVLEDKAKHARSIYGPRGCATMRDDNRHAGYSKSKSDRAEHNGQDSFELRRDIAQYRGAAHPLCYTDEVMDHQIPEGFKPVNIESYTASNTTWPAVTIYTPSNTSHLNSKD